MLPGLGEKFLWPENFYLDQSYLTLNIYAFGLESSLVIEVIVLGEISARFLTY